MTELRRDQGQVGVTCDDCTAGRYVRLDAEMHPLSNVAWCWRERTPEGWAWVRTCFTCNGRGLLRYTTSLPPLIGMELA